MLSILKREIIALGLLSLTTLVFLVLVLVLVFLFFVVYLFVNFSQADIGSF